jgi:glycosyltransferase involved in cell wall biosynthesis
MSGPRHVTTGARNHLLLVLPVYNGGRVLAQSVEQIAGALGGPLSHLLEVVIADNGSTDNTLEIARGLEAKHEFVRVLHLDQKGRGQALRQAWQQSPSDILSYMDVDLSTDVRAYPALIQALSGRGYDLAVGSRLLRASETSRCFKRDLISRTYNLLVKLVFRTRFSDAQCGFKAITRAAANQLLPLVHDDGWFFDTELLVLAEKLGYRIFDLPVRWTESPETTVNLCSTALRDLQGILRLRGTLSSARRVPLRPFDSVRVEPLAGQDTKAY